MHTNNVSGMSIGDGRGQVIVNNTVFGSVADTASRHVQYVEQVIPLSRLRVAALYSGRFFGTTAGTHIAGDHLKNFIVPNSVEVFLAVDPPSWCAASSAARTAYRAGQRAKAEEELRIQASALFSNWPLLLVALVPAEDAEGPHGYGRAAMLAARKAYMDEPSSDANLRRSSIYIHRWYMQFEHVAKVERLRRAFGPHDVVVRLRLDVALTLPLHIHATGRRSQLLHVLLNHTSSLAVLHRDSPSAAPEDSAWLPSATAEDSSSVADAAVAEGSRVEPLELASFGYRTAAVPRTSRPPTEPGTLLEPCMPKQYADLIPHGMSGLGAAGPYRGLQCSEHRPTLWMWSDWVQLGTPRSMSALAAMTSRGRVQFVNRSRVRCYGLCQEEQTVLQLEAMGVRMLPLSLPLVLDKPGVAPCHTTPLLNDTELSRDHKISSWYATCPPVSVRGRCLSVHTAKQPSTGHR